MLKKIGVGLAALAAVAAVTYLRFIRPWQLRWGATNAEVERAMPGDDVVKFPTFNATRGVTIQTRPEEIWPWLASRELAGIVTTCLTIWANRARSALSPNSSTW
jgi:hypothetical protein